MGKPDELSIERKLKQELSPLRKELDALTEVMVDLTELKTPEGSALIKQISRSSTLFTRIKKFIEEELRSADAHPELYTEDMVMKNVQAYEQVCGILSTIEEWKHLCPPEENK